MFDSIGYEEGERVVLGGKDGVLLVPSVQPTASCQSYLYDTEPEDD